VPAEAEVGADVVEIRSTDTLRFCTSCLVSNTSDDAFCTACGAPLPQGTPEEQSVRASAAVPDRAMEAESAARKSRHVASWKLGVSGVLLAAALTGVGVFATLWQLQSGKAHRLGRELAGARSELAATKATLSDTRVRLASTNGLSNRRRAVLLQAQDVLGKVDPLLSSVDNVQSKAGDLAAQGTVLSNDAEAIVSTAADLVNYLVQSSGGYVDSAWVGQEIDTANSEIATLRYDESVFSGDDGRYENASTSFVAKADSFSASIRALQKQLRAVTTK
jgi:hypothetical protein